MRGALAFLAAVVTLAPVSAGEPPVSATRSETFVANGPAGITGGNSYAVGGQGRVAGAVQAIVAHPTDPNVVWIGTVNGGVWKTTNALNDDQNGGPTWTPLKIGRAHV